MQTPAKWVRKVKRRKGGWYVVRTDQHVNRARRETGYVGESNNLKAREKDHLGQGRYGHAAKHWSDLRPVFHSIPLPWWLCWKWVLRSGETVLIWLLAPRYNVQKNRWNPRRIKPWEAEHQRAVRNVGAARYDVQARLAHLGRRTLQLMGVLLILAAIVGTVVTR